MSYKARKVVLRFLPNIHKVRNELGLSAEKYSDAAVLAFIDRETWPVGDPFSRRRSKKYNGILQAYDGYVEDACRYAGVEPFPATELHGKVDKSLWVFFNHMEKYPARHDYRPSLMAALHKGGAGTAKRVHRRVVRKDEPLYEVLADEAKQNPRLGKYVQYVRGYNGRLLAYAQWIEEQNALLGVCGRSYPGDIGELFARLDIQAWEGE